MLIMKLARPDEYVLPAGPDYIPRRSRRREVIVTAKPDAATSRYYLTRKNYDWCGKWVPLKPKPAPQKPAKKPAKPKVDALALPAAWRAEALGISGYREHIAHALEILDREEINPAFNDAEFATVLITRLQPRHCWRLFDGRRAEDIRDARQFITTTGEAAIQFIKAQPN